MSVIVHAKPAQRRLDDRLAFDDVVPPDLWRPVRLTLTASYVLFLVWWTATRGMIWQRMAVAAFLGGFLLCSHIGRPLRTWALVVRDALFYCAMWFAYETTRTAARDGVLGFTPDLQVESMRNIDRFLFGGNDPNVWLQEALWRDQAQWWDKLLSTVYYSHFMLPPIVMAALWASNRYQFWRFMRRFATVLSVACAMFVVLPTAPPWLAADKGVIDPLVRQTGRGFSAMGFRAYTNGWQDAVQWGNPVAAMPSLHAGFAMIIVAFFLPWIRPRWLKAAALLFPATMLFALVYLAEHWVIDGLVGWAVVGGSFWLWHRLETWHRQRRATASLAALTP
jgi:hypothetical protein